MSVALVVYVGYGLEFFVQPTMLKKRHFISFVGFALLFDISNKFHTSVANNTPFAKQ